MLPTIAWRYGEAFARMAREHKCEGRVDFFDGPQRALPVQFEDDDAVNFPFIGPKAAALYKLVALLIDPPAQIESE